MDLDPDFPNRIRTQETKSDRDLDPEKKDPDPKNCRPDHPHLGGHLEYLDNGLLVEDALQDLLLSLLLGLRLRHEVPEGLLGLARVEFDGVDGGGGGGEGLLFSYDLCSLLG